MGRHSNLYSTKDLFVRVTLEQLQIIHTLISNIFDIRDSLFLLGSTKLPSSSVGSLISEAVTFYENELSSHSCLFPVASVSEVDINESIGNTVCNFNDVLFGDIIINDSFGEGVVISVLENSVKIRFGYKKTISFTREQFDSEKFKRSVLPV